jgi:predicted DNA-binding transcriptional regulator YafY
VTEYKTSSFCNLGDCVEVGRSAEGGVLVRDSKNRDQPPLAFTPEEWAAFVAGVKAGEFDPS